MITIMMIMMAMKSNVSMGGMNQRPFKDDSFGDDEEGQDHEAERCDTHWTQRRQKNSNRNLVSQSNPARSRRMPMLMPMPMQGQEREQTWIRIHQTEKARQRLLQRRCYRCPPSVSTVVLLTAFIIVSRWIVDGSTGSGSVSAFLLSSSETRRRPILSMPRAATSLGTRTKTSTTQLCGIKGFRSWLSSQFPEAVVAIDRDHPKATQDFDHVLIDVNYVLHNAVRRSKNEGHAMSLLMRELDALLITASPRKSLVLAMDGPPGAAKLALQRARRFALLRRNEWKLKQLEKYGDKKKKKSSRQYSRIRDRYKGDLKTLAITPGTQFMEQARDCLLYWAWQRIQNRSSVLSKKRVSVFLSTSEAPGEGEIKMIDWVLQNKPKGTVALVGGDSDLVLESWILPPSVCSHNVFVLLPEGKRGMLAVSIWESTRTLASLVPQLPPQDMMRIRNDVVLLLILSGNDYFPKLRGSRGFYRIMSQYMTLLRKYLNHNASLEQDRKGGTKGKTPKTKNKKNGDPADAAQAATVTASENLPGFKQPFLVDPNCLRYNLDFAIDFFHSLKPSGDLTEAAKLSMERNIDTPVRQLNSVLDMAFISLPLEWTLIENKDLEDSYDDEEEEEEEEEEDQEEEEESVEDDDDMDDDDDDEHEAIEEEDHERLEEEEEDGHLDNDDDMEEDPNFDADNFVEEAQEAHDDDNDEEEQEEQEEDSSEAVNGRALNVNNDSDDDDGDGDDDDDDETLKPVGHRTRMRLRLTIGNKGTSDYLVFETWHKPGQKLKNTKNKLAARALAELLGTGDGSDDDDDDDDLEGSTNEDPSKGFFSSSEGYDWEVSLRSCSVAYPWAVRRRFCSWRP